MDLSWVEFGYRGSHVRLGGLAGDHIFETVRRTGSFYELALLEDTPAPSLVLDVGANIGNHTVYWGLVSGAKVVAVEPSPKLASIMLRNVQANNLQDQVTLVQAAAGAQAGWAWLQEGPTTNLGQSKVVEAMIPKGISIEVQALDAIWAGLGGPTPDLVKIDVEGYTQQVLAGAHGILQTGPDIIVELATVEELEQTRVLLSDLGYRYFRRLPAWTATYLFCW